MRNIFSLILLSTSLQGFTQVNFEKLSLNDAIKKAATTGKLVFAQLESTTCFQCNEVADVAFASKQVTDAAAKRFISIKVTATHPDRQAFIEKYASASPLGSYFISGDGELIHRYGSTSTMHTHYLEQFDKAYNKPLEGRITLEELNREWNENPSNITAMETNLSKRSSLALPTDSLLDIYVKRLPNDSFYSQRTIAFIIKQAPSLFSKANSKIKNDQNLYTTTWYTLPLQERISINNRIAAKSMNIAIAEKNRSKAMNVAGFHAGTHTDRYSRAALKTYEKKMLDYFIGIRDTSTYLKKAVDYYETFYMSEPLSKVHEQDSLARSKAMQNSTIQNVRIVDPSTDKLAKTLDSLAPERRMKPLNMGDPKDVALKKMMDSVVMASRMNRPQNGNDNTIRRVVAQQSFTYAPTSQYYANDLNSGAWLIYTSTSDKKYLSKALAFAKRATEAYASPEVMDTYARLLYKTGEQQQAIGVMEEAILIVKERQRNSVPRFEAVLNKIKAGEKID